MRFANPCTSHFDLAYGGELKYITKKEDIKDYIFMALRKIDGIKFSDFEERYGRGIEKYHNKEIKSLIKRGLLEKNDERIFLTKKGLDFANEVFREFF
jgi:oxygen-independent coproporphyrinogen-3 oxidase